MSSLHFILLIPLFCFISNISSVQSRINVWPKPRNLSWLHPQATLLSPSFRIISPKHRYLTPAVDRYRHLVLSERHRSIVSPVVNLTFTHPLQAVKLTVTDLKTPLQHGVDESYTLTIPTVGAANLTARTVWGAMRGLETFSQLVWGDPPCVPTGLSIYDSPIFGHRGVMLDTSRNYYGVEHILRTIRAMSANKLNVFHWHITDSHSFPLVLPSEPELARKGSYGPDMQYSPADVKRIVEYGFRHGVRVLPEIDAPGLKPMKGSSDEIIGSFSHHSSRALKTPTKCAGSIAHTPK